MNFTQRTAEIKNQLHKGNSKVMAPITLSAVLGIIIYISASFHWLLAPLDHGDQSVWGRYVFYFQTLPFIKIILICLLGAAINTLFFEIWTRRELSLPVRALAYDPARDQLSERELVASLVALIDFPYRFIRRFIIHWLIGTPLIILTLKLFYQIPWTTLLYFALGVLSIMCLMSVYHYFAVKNAYTRRQSEAFQKLPHYYKLAEFQTRRISYRRKLLFYIIVLVAAVTWITTHISSVGQDFSTNYELNKQLSSRIKNSSNQLIVAQKVGMAHSEFVLAMAVQDLLGFQEKNHDQRAAETERYYLLDDQGNFLVRSIDPAKAPTAEKKEVERLWAIDRAIMSRLPGVDGDVARWRSVWGRVKSELRILQPLIARITDEVVEVPRIALDESSPAGEPYRYLVSVMVAYAGGAKYSVELIEVASKVGAEQVTWRVIGIQPDQPDLVEYLFQMGPVLAMFGLAIALSFQLVRFMRHEVMSLIARIIESSERIERGDLSESPPIMADDEFGELASHHLRMVDGVRTMIGRIGDGASLTHRVSGQLSDLTDEMAKGSQSQSVAVEETSAIIAQMNQTISSIAESVDTLASSAEESSAAIIQMSATNDEVANNSESLSETVTETTASIQQMSASIREVADNVRNTAGKTEEVAASMRDMSRAVKLVEGIATESAGVAREVTADAEIGARAVESTISGIGQIKTTSREAADVIERLQKRAQEIGRILTVIEDVTEETNLLALNAAIIAAQEGEHGKGFAVVADEIKDLAERTQASTAEIADQIQAVRKDAAAAVAAVTRGEDSVNRGVQLSQEAGAALHKILESAQRSMEMAQRISDSTIEQSRKVEQILGYFESIASMIDQIHAATSEQSKGSEQIILASEKMRDISVQVKKATREQAQGSRQISQAIEHITHIASYINTSQAEQKKAAQQVLSAITKISDIAHQNARGVEQTLESVGHLRDAAAKFRETIGEFGKNHDDNSESHA